MLEKTLRYLNLTMIMFYLVGGAYLLLGQYVGYNTQMIPNAQIIGGCIMGYGIFRLVRFAKADMRK
ncbi:MAG: hypothetical protein NW207_11975 [Cytophagales bacterium]|nr:hypothetical protein [Cytophagales bacterium]